MVNVTVQTFESDLSPRIFATRISLLLLPVKIAQYDWIDDADVFIFLQHVY